MAHRIRLRAQRDAAKRWPKAASVLLFEAYRCRRSSWPTSVRTIDAEVLDAFPSAEANARGEFCFLSETRLIGEPEDWQQSDASLLWRFHLHYFDWAWSFAEVEDRSWAHREFTRLWRSWRDRTDLGDPVAWSPYVASVRAWVLTGVYRKLVAGTDIDTEFVSVLALHARFIRLHLELDVGGNHLVKNLKALVGLAVFFGDRPLLRRVTRRLERELQVQVLSDGGHYERSPSYHCQVLADLLDIQRLLEADGRAPLCFIDRAVVAMRAWLAAMVLPDGEVPLLNDCIPVGERRLTALNPGPSARQALVVLDESGYVVAKRGERLHLVADVGEPCPPNLPAHAHADCLTFELCVHGTRVIVDAGTSSYAASPIRTYERSTRAHNTIEVDCADQTEVWDVFRAARRARSRLLSAREEAGAIIVSGEHDGYRRLPGGVVHRRTWLLSDDRVEILDEILGAGRHRAVAFLHLSPEIRPLQDADGRVRVGPVVVSGSEPLRIMEAGSEPLGWTAWGFGRRRASACLVLEVDRDLPTSMSLTIAAYDSGAVDEAPKFITTP